MVLEGAGGCDCNFIFHTGAYNHRRHSDAAHSAAAGDRHCGTGHVAGTRSARLKQQKMEL